MTQINTASDVHTAARDDYEAARRNVSGRPAWEALNDADDYDRGMKEYAYVRVTEPLAEHPVDYDGVCACALCRSYA